MREKTYSKKWAGVFIILFAGVSGVMNAQPGPGQLADQVLQVNSDRLSAINQLVITVETDGGFIPGSTTRYEKTENAGKFYLKPVFDDVQTQGMMDGVFDDQMSEMIRAASSVNEEDYEGYTVYRIVVDDPEKINEFMQDDFEFDENPTEVKSISLWLDKDELIGRKIYIEQENDEGTQMNVELLLEDYQTHAGLPVAHTIYFNIEGLNEQFSEEDREEARKAMQQMEEQLSQMSEAQRKMIEQQMKPQMEQFKKMMESDDIGKMVFKVVDVQVNPDS